MEFGATTGRARRCGWLDMVLIRFACMVNGVTDLAVTIVDGLDERETIKVCVAYDIDGRRVEQLPYHQSDLHRATPIYEEFPGWKTDQTTAREPGDLHPNAAAYLRALEDRVGVPVSLASTGPGRDQFLHFSNVR